jgi:hypothetical protein
VTTRLLRRAPALAVVLAGTLALSACGESKEEKAIAQVCTARGEIKKQITKLEGLTISSNTVNEAKASFEAIGKQLTKIKEAQPDLEPKRKQQIEPATQTFSSELSTIASGVVATLGSGNLETALKNAGPQLKSAVTKLGSAYQQAYAPVSCP